MAHSIVIINRDEVHSRTLRTLLVATGFRVQSHTSTASALPGLQSGTYDLCLLEIDLPEIDGVDICRAIRSSGVTVPIIAMTANTNEESRRTQALGAGADDVVPKSMGLRELVARMRAVLRRSGRELSSVAYEDEELTVQLDQMRAILGGREIPLSRGEARVLSILIGEAPAPVPSIRLWRELSPEEDHLKPATVEARIKSLRRKLGANRIETRARFGYAFVLRKSS